MTDIVVRGLDELAGNLDELCKQFKGALDFQNDEKGRWGQRNANSSMGDFADNWTRHRNKMTDAMQALHDLMDKADLSWAEGDKQLRDTLDGKK